MKEFDVTITETLKLTVSVEASSKEEAQQMVSDQWHAGDHILDADNFVEVEFESNDGKEISAERAPDDTIEVLMVEPGQYPRVERIGSDLASLQKAVDGYIEAIYPYTARNMVETCDVLFTNFPGLLEKPDYKDQVIEIMQEPKQYILKLEGETDNEQH